MKAGIWMPFYPADYLADTQHLSTELHGAYCLLLMAYWSRQGPLRDSDAELALITRLGERRWKQLRPTLEAFFHVKDGLWYQNRCERELAEARENKAAAQRGAYQTNAKRWGNRVAQRSPSDRPAIAQRVVSESPKGRSSPSPSPISNTPHPPTGVEEPTPDDFPRLGGGAEAREEAASIDQVERVWALWPKKVDTCASQIAIRAAIRRRGFDAVLDGTRKIVTADAERKASPPGRFLPRPVEFFEGDRFLDDPAQYGPRGVVQDPLMLRRRIEQLEAAVRDHPGNPTSPEGSQERKVAARPEWQQLRRELAQARREWHEQQEQQSQPQTQDQA